MKHLARPALAAALVAAAAATALPADARVARPVELTRSTTFVASTSGWLDVVVPEDAVMDKALVSNPDVSISGTGRLVGLEMYRRDAQFGYWFPSLSTFRYPGFTGLGTRTWGDGTPPPECEAELLPGDPLPEECTYPEQQRIELLQGRYRVRVLTDGAPVRITLDLQGLDEGETTLRPVNRLRSLQKPLPALDAIGDEVVTFGATGLTGAVDGAVFANATLSGTGTLEEASRCSRADDGPPPPFAYDSTCAGGDGGATQRTVRLGGQEYTTWSGFVSSSSAEPTAPAGLGGGFRDSDGVTLGETLGVWLDRLPQ